MTNPRKIALVLEGLTETHSVKFPHLSSCCTKNEMFLNKALTPKDCLNVTCYWLFTFKVFVCCISMQVW